MKGEVHTFMKEPTPAARFEPLWPVALAILAVLFVLTLLPGRIKPFPNWFPYVVGIVVVLPMAASRLTAANPRWLRIEQMVTLAFILVAGASNLVSLIYLIHAMVSRSEEIGGLQLLTSSVGVWIINTLIFSLLYRQMDRGGPEARLNNAGTKPDWLFPQEGAPAEDVPPEWRPSFVDYLFLGYSTATAFSTTDVVPLTSRAKILMMLESTISLVTIVVVAARAINILGN
jgi:uncharacterized membrane protein